MPTVRIPVRIDYTNAGGPGYNVWHVRTVSELPGTDLSEPLNALEAFYTKCKALYQPGTRIVIGEGMINDPLGSPTYVDDDSRTVLGSGASGATPTMVALCVSWRTQAATRSGRGRTFLGPVAMGTLQADGTPEPAILAACRNAALDLVGDSMTANGWAFGVLSTKERLIRDFTGSTIRDRWAVLTSRRG
jgi:hypothetical protein